MNVFVCCEGIQRQINDLAVHTKTPLSNRGLAVNHRKYQLTILVGASLGYCQKNPIHNLPTIQSLLKANIARPFCVSHSSLSQGKLQELVFMECQKGSRSMLSDGIGDDPYESSIPNQAFSYPSQRLYLQIWTMKRSRGGER